MCHYRNTKDHSRIRLLANFTVACDNYQKIPSSCLRTKSIELYESLNRFVENSLSIIKIG